MTTLHAPTSDQLPAIPHRSSKPTTRRTPASCPNARTDTAESGAATPSVDSAGAVEPGTRNSLLPVIGGPGERAPEVPLVDGRRTRYTNLDYAASAPLLASVDAHVHELLPYYASVHRGAGYASQICTTVYENAREEVARFLGARSDDVVVFTRNTTDALNLLATAVPTTPEGTDEPRGVLYLDVEHHANLLPWQRRADGTDEAGEAAALARCLPAGTTQRGTLVALRAELAARPAALVAVTGASNVTGEVLPIADIAAIAHQAGARLVVDAAQLAPHRRIDMTATGVDYLAFSGHKLYAPLGAGVLVGRRDWLDAAPAYLAGGGAVRSVDLQQTAWATAPARHEGGTPNILGAAAIAQACKEIGALDAGVLEDHENALRARLVSAFDARDGVTVHRIWRDSPDAVGVVTFTVDGHDAGLVAAYLSAEHGIGVRDGKFCAHPLLKRLGIAGGAVRASFGLGTTAEDVDRLVAAVDALLSDGPRWTYGHVDGRCEPTPDPRPRPAWAATAAGPAPGASPCEPSV